MVKHQPATALPWFDVGNALLISTGPVPATWQKYQVIESSDVPYIVRAANAYPKLVEAIRDDLSAFAILTARDPRAKGLPNRRIDQINILLRSLGEL